MTPPVSTAIRRPTPFARWLRTGFWLAEQAADPALEVKFNPYHDPTNGQFTFGPGGAGSAGMTQPPKQPQRGKDDRSWTGAFHGGGGGSTGGGGATGSGYWPNPTEQRAFRQRHPDLDPHMLQPGETLDRVAAAHHVTTAELRALNGLASGTSVKPGQVLALPKRGAAARAPATSPIRKNGYTFQRDRGERTSLVTGDLTFAETPSRSTHNQRAAGKPDRRSDDDGGHFVAARFNGPSDKFNHFAQNRNFNRGRYRDMENEWAADLHARKHVSVAIAAHYPGASKRPDVINITWKVNGRSKERQFFNRDEGKSRGR